MKGQIKQEKNKEYVAVEKSEHDGLNQLHETLPRVHVNRNRNGQNEVMGEST